MKYLKKFEVQITITYLIIGICWIIFTDYLLELFINDLENMTLVQSFKGIIYVFLSAWVIYYLSTQYSKKQQQINEHLQQFREKAEEDNRLKTAFLANMSHEIRTPMNGILGFISLLENPQVGEENRKLFLGYVKKSSDRLLETINDIIEISKIESNQSVLNLNSFELNETLNYLYGFFMPAAEQKGLAFKLENELADQKILIISDKNKLESILINFIKNAIKFTQEGYIEIGCRKQKNNLVFYVKDTGIGIPKNKHSRVFERFVQADLNDTKPYEGSGLGLAIVKAYAHQLNGKVWMESEKGKGSTFWFSMMYKPVLEDGKLILKSDSSVKRN